MIKGNTRNKHKPLKNNNKKIKIKIKQQKIKTIPPMTKLVGSMAASIKRIETNHKNPFNLKNV